MRRNVFEPKRVRVSMNQVTGEMQYTILDEVQKQYEEAIDAVHRCCANCDSGSQQRFKEKILAFALELVSGAGSTDSETDTLRKMNMKLAARVDRASEVLTKVAERCGSDELAELLTRPAVVWVNWPGLGRNGKP